ncbi:MAG: restriction endonuclease subunit S [Thauera sp.]
MRTTLGAVVDYGATSKVEPDEIADDTWVLELEDVERDTSRLLGRFSYVDRMPKSTKNRFAAGDVLYGKLRPYLNKVLIADRPGVCTTEIIPLDGRGFADNRFLFYWLKHPCFLDYVNSVSHGVNMPRLGTEAGRAAPFVVAPLPEQKRIADKLDNVLARVDACRDRLDRIPALLKRFRQSVLAAATSGRLTDEWRSVHYPDREPESPKCSALSERSPIVIFPSDQSSLQVGWRWQKLTELAQLESGHTPRKSVPEYWEGGDVPWISLQDIRAADGTVIYDTKYKPTKLGIANSSARLLPAGTVCFCRDISFGYVTIMGKEMATTQHFANWVCGAQLVPSYLMYAFMAGRDFLGMSGQGTTVTTIYMPALKELRLATPPLAEQHEIVRRVETLFAFADRLEARCAAARKQAGQLTPALLAEAFRGELVPQDPADEPAAELLKRLAASRAEAPKARRGRKP